MECIRGKERERKRERERERESVNQGKQQGLILPQRGWKEGM